MSKEGPHIVIAEEVPPPPPTVPLSAAPPPAPKSAPPSSSSPSTFTFAPEILSRYEMGAMLGKGAYGTVYKGTCRATGAEVAVKMIPRARVGDAVDKIEREIRIMGGLGLHEGLARLISYFVTEEHFVIVAESVTGGELLKHLLKVKRYSEQNACLLIFNLLRVVRHMHVHGVMHCDIKPENLLLTKTPTYSAPSSSNPDEISGDEITDIKLIDFGLARFVKIDAMPSKACGSPMYIAPEVLEAGINYTRPHYDFKADVWSVGIIAYLLLSGLIPFYAPKPKDIFDLVLGSTHTFDHPAWENISAEGKAFVDSLLQKDPAKRPTAAEALLHPWMRRCAEGMAEAEGEAAKAGVLTTPTTVVTAVGGGGGPTVVVGGVGPAVRRACARRAAIETVFENLRYRLDSYCAAKGKGVGGEGGVGGVGGGGGDQCAASSSLSSSVAAASSPSSRGDTHVVLADVTLETRGVALLCGLLRDFPAAITRLDLSRTGLTDIHIDLLAPFLVRSACHVSSLILDGNAITQQGGRVLLNIARYRNRFVRISLGSGNTVKEAMVARIEERCAQNAATMARMGLSVDGCSSTASLSAQTASLTTDDGEAEHR